MSKIRKTHVTLKLLWEEYRREHPDGYSLTQFRYHYNQNTEASKEKKVSTILTDLLVPDNLKAAIVKSDRYEPSVNRILEDMANHYGCFILPTRPVHPKDKSLVEDHVK